MDVSLANATILVAGVLSVILVLLWTIIESIYNVSDVERDIDRTKVSRAFSLCYLGLFLTSGLLAAIVEFGFDARIDDSSYAILGWMMVIWMVPGFTEVMIDELKKEASKQEPHPNEVDISKRTGVPYGWRESLFDLVYNPYPVCKNPFCNTRFAKQDSQSLGISSDFCPPCWMIKNGQPKRCDVRGCKNQFTRPEFKDPDFYSLNENEKRDNDLVTMRTIKWEICHDCEGVLDKFSDIYVPVARRGNKTRQALDRDGKVLLRPDEEDMPIWRYWGVQYTILHEELVGYNSSYRRCGKILLYNKNESNPVLGTPTVKRELKATREILRASDGVLCDCAVVEYWSPVVDGEEEWAHSEY